MEKTITVYKDSNGKTPYFDWLFDLKDNTVRNRILSRIDRVRHGNYGDHKRFHGIVELKFHFGKGYRVYFGEVLYKIGSSPFPVGYFMRITDQE